MTQLDSSPPPLPRPGLIRITAEEANSQHVDDLLKRQMSLRGEGGLTRDRKSKWYLRNWFVFGLAGLLAAIAAWAIIEPFFHDKIYWQGIVEEIGAPGALYPGKIYGMPVGAGGLNAPSGYIKVNGQVFLLSHRLRLFKADGSKTHLQDLSETGLKVKDPVGLYTSRVPLDDEYKTAADVALFVVADPAALRPGLNSKDYEGILRSEEVVNYLFFPIVAICVGLAIGISDALICRVLHRALLAALVAVLVGLIGGFIAGVLGNVVYSLFARMVLKHSTDEGLSTVGFLIQIGSRGTAWALAGVAMGLTQGIVLRSGRLLLYGFLGGVIGGLLGGLLFDPIDLLLLGPDKLGAGWSRAIGLAVIGCSVGAMIGIVELLARDAWLRMLQGPLAGKEFLIFKDTMHLGASPRSEIYLFNDDQVAPQHAIVRAVGDNYELENTCPERPALVNGRPATRSRLRHGDQITIGRTVFTFNRQRGS